MIIDRYGRQSYPLIDKPQDLWYTDYMFCNRCGNRLVNGDCNFCFDNSNTLKEFEDEDE